MSKLLPMLDPFDEIKRIYFSTTKQTIDRDMARALELLTHMPSDEARQRVAGFMHGLSDLKREWKPKGPTRHAQAQGQARSAEGPGIGPQAYDSRVVAARFRAAMRSGSGMLRSSAISLTSLSLMRCSRFIEIASGVLGLRTSPATTP